MEVKPVRYFSHSRASRDEECERARYYGSEWGGTGIQSTSVGWDLVFGNLQHKYLNDLAQTGSIDYRAARAEVLQTALTSGMDQILARDYSVLAEGQLRGFVRYLWKSWLRDYRVVEAEKMRRWEIKPGFVFRYRQDILLQSVRDSTLVYVDYKTTSSNSPQWIAAWAKSPQLHSSMYAMQQGDGINVQHAIVPGFYKGYKDKKDNSLRSIFCYGWVNREYSMMPQYSYEYQRSRGWERFSTADEFPDLGTWVANMPENVLSEQFPTTAPIFPRHDIATKYFRQQLIREAEVQEALQILQTSTDVKMVEETLDRYFRQDFSNCQPAFGYPCEFRDLCWQSWVEADPLGSGLYIRKEPAEVEVIP